MASGSFETMGMLIAPCSMRHAGSCMQKVHCGAPAGVAVTVSARLHLGFLDLNGEFGRRFGSLGLSISEPRGRLTLRRADAARGGGGEGGGGKKRTGEPIPLEDAAARRSRGRLSSDDRGGDPDARRARIRN